VRFIVAGRGVFYIHPPEAPVFAIEMQAGDLINVPAGTQHWFDLCQEKMIRAIRLFVDDSGWAPYYMEQGVHSRYESVCFGPTYVSPANYLETK
jgi:1,2-dihydroxy-3-keto-5-methylthiopentene dioxygenase